MNANQLQRAQELFESVLSLPPEQRAAFLAEASGHDPTLRAEVESLLEHDRQADDTFMQVPAVDPRSQPAPELDATRPIEEGADDDSLEVPSIAGYQITGELSRGGQGIVYQAIQEYTKRQVAIKVLLAGSHTSEMARRRFEREIELVAQLRHPNIISIFHSGRTPDRRQFYVMDFVEGRPLDQHVRAENLTLENTLELFSTICEAVQYAHRMGVIHRDLKPSNIIIDAQGAPKILDFGLAKPLAAPAESLMSFSQEIVGTLPYMSPEQAGGTGEIDTRTDVYSLGVILYELLTGHRPYPVQGLIPDVLRHITETPPSAPSRSWTRDAGVTRRASRRLRVGECPIDSEIETVLYKALAKERERRYQSAGELARDIRHYLAGEPIEARGDALAYVLWKLSRRYFRQAPAAALALLCAFLAPGFVVSVMFWRQATQERDTANAAIAFLNNDVFQSLDPERSGREVDLTELLDAASQRIGQRFEHAPLAEASIRHTLGNFYYSLGENEEALAHLQAALRLRQSQLGELHLVVAESHVSLSRVLESMGQSQDAERHLDAALQTRARLLGERDPLVTDTVAQFAAFARRRGNLELEALLLARAGLPAAGTGMHEPTADGAADAREQAETRLAEAQRIHGSAHPEVADRLTALADLMMADGEYAQARPLYERALAILSAQLGPEHLRAREAFKKLEQIFDRSGQPEEIVPFLVSRLDRVLFGPHGALALADASWDVVKAPHRPADLYLRALEAAQRACTLQPGNGAFLNTLGVAQYRAGRFSDALATLRQSDRENDGHPADIAFLTMTLAQLGQVPEARHEFERLQTLMQAAPWATDPQSLRFLQEASTLLAEHN